MPHPTFSSMELLESRIAPAAVLILSDIDGDKVTISTSKGTVADLTTAVETVPVGLGVQIQRINLTPALFEGTTLSVVATRSATGGNDFVNVGLIDATGIDLGAVKIDGDLGRIIAGDVDVKPGLGGLTVQTLGALGTATQAAKDTPSVESVIKGSVGAVSIKGNMVESYFRAETDGVAIGNILSFSVGGMLGGPGSDSGRLEAAGNIGPVLVKGSILAGDGARSGSVDAGGKIASISVKGSLVGSKTVQDTGIIEADLGIGPVIIGGDIKGGDFQNTGAINTQGFLTSVSVTGSLIGGAGVGSGQIEAGSAGPITVLGSVIGGVGNDSGQIKTGGKVGAVKVGGALTGSSGLRSGAIIAGTSTSEGAGAIAIGQDITGGSADHSGSISVAGSIASVAVGGSVRGGTASNTGLIEAGTGTGIFVSTLGPVSIRGSLLGSSLPANATANLENTGYITGQKMAPVIIRADIITGDDFSTGFDLINNASIRAQKNLGGLTVGGSMLGNEQTRVLVTAETAVVPTNYLANLTMGAVSVAGSVYYSDILVGYIRDSQDLVSPTSAASVNFDAQMTSLRVGGDWMGSNLAVGAEAGPDGFLGTMDDQRALPGGPGLPVNAYVGSVSIAGQVLSTPSTTDRYGIVAEYIVAMKIGGATVGLTPLGRSDIEASAESPRFFLSDDTRFHEVPVA